MNRRAVWKGRLSFEGLGFGIGLYSALSSSEKVSFNIVNRKTGNRVERRYLDSETGKPVERDQQIRGYQTDDGDYILVENDALKQLMPESEKVMAVKSFIACDDIDKLYFDKPYYLAPAADGDEEAFRHFAEALKNKEAAAFAEAVLFRRNRAVLIRPHEHTLVAHTLNYDYEVRSAKNAFKTLPEPDHDPELLELAGHIIETRMGRFDPADYQDRYNAALRELVQAKIEGREIKAPRLEPQDNVIDLREALRRSAGAGGKAKRKTTPKSAAKAGRKAG